MCIRDRLISGARYTGWQIHRRFNPATPQPEPFAFQYNQSSVFVVGIIHGLGAETPSQLLLFLLAANLGGTSRGFLGLPSFIVRLLMIAHPDDRIRLRHLRRSDQPPAHSDCRHLAHRGLQLHHRSHLSLRHLRQASSTPPLTRNPMSTEPIYATYPLSLIHISEPTRQAEISYAV